MKNIHKNPVNEIASTSSLDERKPLTTQTPIFDLKLVDQLSAQVAASFEKKKFQQQYRTISYFNNLRDEWYAAMAICSGGDERFMHPAYQRIIGLGPDVIPCVLQELDKNGAAWNWALKALTGANPVKPESRGRSKRIARDWMDWAEENNVILHERNE